MTAPATRGPSATRRALPWVLALAAIVLAAVVIGPGRRSGRPLDPRSTDPSGTRALVFLLGELGHHVSIGTQPPPAGTAVLLADRLGSRQRARVRAWVEAGGVLVVADPLSPFAPAIDRGRGGLFDSAPSSDLAPRCDLPALAKVGTIYVPAPAGFRAKPGDIACFPVGEAAFLVARAAGRGTIFAMAGAGPFTNDALGEADNSVLAASVVGRGDVVVLEPDAPGSGQSSLLDLVSPRIKDGLWQLLLAFGIVVLWRARRLGRPVVDTQPVEIPGSELVVAVGNLLQQARRRDQAAAMLRADVRRVLSERLGLPADAGPQVVADAVAMHTALPASTIAAALGSDPPVDDDALVALAQSIDAIRREVTHV
ncbi:MAG TPA: DUF4350 domain-containing protein [Acidimicrobiales bacterium]|nr:DUF4350 domain-containing protein [Acidimicrobiales bacterium]